MRAGARARAPAAIAVGAAPGEVTVAANGVRLLVQASDAALLALVRDALPTGAVLRAGGGQAHVSYRIARSAADATGDGALRVVIHDPSAARPTYRRVPDDAALAALLADDLEFRIALHAPEHLFVHAAAVARRGRAVSLPGRSRAGKSTLAAALVQAGAEYMSDEFTVLTADGLVRPYPRPLHLRAADGSAGRQVDPLSIGTVRTAAAPLALVALTSYRRGAQWRAHTMSRGETALALFRHAVAARRRPAAALERIARATTRGEVMGVRGARGDATEMAAWVLDWLDRSVAETWAS